MARRRRRGSLKRVSAANLKKLLKSETKDDLIKLILKLEGVSVRKGGKKRGPGRPRKHRGPGRPRRVGRPRKSHTVRRSRKARGSYARVGRRDRRGRLLKSTSRARKTTHRRPGRPRKVGRPRTHHAKRRSTKRGSYARTGARYTSGPLKGKLMPRSHTERSYSIPGIKQRKGLGSLESRAKAYWASGE